MRASLWGVALWLCAAGASTAVGAQVGSGQVTGLVRDAAGAPVPGAMVTARQVETSATRRTVSSAAGVYTLPGLAPGAYRVDVALAGFRPAVRTGLRVETGETLRLDFDLAVGGVRESVTVTGEASSLRAATASLGHVISHETIAALPLNGRSFTALTALVPGVALPPASQLPRINGGRPRTNEYLFDGISVLQPEPGQIAFFPIIDAIQTLEIETNSPPAEFGRFNGGVVNLTTRSGSNVVHGTGFGFARHEALNARPVFAAAGAGTPAFRRGQFGGVLGGPLARDRTFFFVDYQGQRQGIGRTAVSTVPTLLQRQGIFTESIGGRVPAIYDPATTAPGGSGGFTRTAFAGGAIPASRLDPVALALLQRYPRPTSPGTANNYQRGGLERDDQDQFDVRLDHRLASDQFFGRLTFVSSVFDPVTPLPEGSGLTSGTLGPQATRAWAFASRYQRASSSRWLNEARLGDTRRSVARTAARLAGAPAASPGLPGIPSTARFADTLPTFQISGYQQLGSPANTASDFGTSVTEVADSLTWVVGRHTVKAGADIRWQRLDVVQPPSPTGLFVFSSLFSDLPGTAGTGSPLASFLLGQVQAFSIDLQQEPIRNRAHVQEYFVQDDWRISDRLTVAPGVRYTLNFPSTEVLDQAAVFNLATQQLDYLGTEGRPRAARRLHKTNVGPRLGLVARATDATVVSAGYGLVWIEQAGITTPFTTPVFPFLQTVSQRTLDNVTPAFVLAHGPTVAPIPLTPQAGLGQGVFSVDADLGSGYVQQWNLAAQRALSPTVSLEVAYVGSKITRVGLPDVNINQLSAEQLTLGDALLQRVPNPYFGVIPRSSSIGGPTIPLAQLLRPYPAYTTVSLYRNNVGNSNYHGLTAKLEQRLARGLSYLVSYTRSRLMDDASSVFDASILTGPVANYPVADSFNRRLERDYSTGDMPHVLVASAVWDVPVGHGRARRGRGVTGALASDWTLAAVATLQSGTPVAVTQATNFNSFAGFGTQRPNLVGRPGLPASRRSAARWFDTDAFAVAPVFTLGSSTRNPVRGPAYRNVDLALSRRVPIGAGTSLELRAEAFNLLNTPRLGNPNAVLGAADFGTITTAGDPRVVQLAVKLVF